MDAHQRNVDTGSSAGYTGQAGSQVYLQSHFGVNSEERGKEPPPELHPILEKDGLNTQGGWFFSDIREDNCKSSFRNYYLYDENTATGAIIVGNNEREPGAMLP